MLLRLLWALVHLIFPALARQRSQGQHASPPRTPPSSEPGVTSCTTPPPAAPADEPATTAGPYRLADVAYFAPTSRPGDNVDVLLITDTTPRAELEEALTHLAATASRLPRHYVDRKAAIHARIDALLDEWQAASVEA